jgi:hypothetical protein
VEKNRLKPTKYSTPQGRDNNGESLSHKNFPAGSSNTLFDNAWRELARVSEGWARDVMEDTTEEDAIYLNTISRWFSEFPGTKKQKNHLKASLESFSKSDHLGAVNELSWWKFWKSRDFGMEPIPTGKNSTPDFILNHDIAASIFEVTTLNPSTDERCNDLGYSKEKSVKRITAKVISEKLEQLRYGCKSGVPTIFVLFNYDEWSGFGTQFFRTIRDYIFISNMPPELSAIVYVERFNIGGIPCFKKSSLTFAINPKAKIPCSDIVKHVVEAADDNGNWVLCEKT